MTGWFYQGKYLKVPPEGYYGFLYVILADNKLYYGKKAFSHRKKTKLSKKARLGTRKRISITQKDSGWLSYYGSCKPLLEYLTIKGFDNCERSIVAFCKTKQDLAYHELALLIKNNVLFNKDCWNGNVAGKYFKGKINDI